VRVLVTGGAGFIGSHLVDHLMEEGFEVVVLDSLVSGSEENLARWEGCPGFSFLKADLLTPGSLSEALEGCEGVYHLAANPEVNLRNASPSDHFHQNVEATYRLLEAVRSEGGVRFMVFTSSSTVYGEPSVIPTPEDYAPLEPISLYGASKLACEALLSGYSHMYGFSSYVYRLANIVGPRSNHGVIYDFTLKLRLNPRELEVLGDGTQSKSYLYVEDCVEALQAGLSAGGLVNVFNVGSDDRVSVLEIAEAVKKANGLEGAEVRLTGGVDGGRGWRGDVKVMLLDTGRIKSLGWRPKHTSWEAVYKTAVALAGGLEGVPKPKDG